MSKSTLGTLLIITTLSLVAASFFFSQTAVSGGSDDDNEGYFSKIQYRGVMPVKNSEYQNECSSCHMAYSPGLLPAKSWQKIMTNLDDHFGDNAELLPESQQNIANYLLKNAADKSNYYRSKSIVRSLRNHKVVDRITQTPYFIRKHHEIPKRYVINNPKVGSFSQCNACHLNAEKSSFNEDEVSIPGVGYWHE
ncbi:MAG: diheme cytochrome c [Alteromonadaceae bacterium]|nr:diheme cytochrome c [Alteromonadaceae bacterium]